MKNSKWVALSLLIIAIGCSSSRITHTWVSATAAQKQYSKIMVVSLMKDYDHNLRERMESHMVSDLNSKGFTATSAFMEYGPKEFDNSNEAAVIDKIKSSGVDAIMTIVLLNKEKERYYVPGRVNYSPYAVYQRRFWGYYSTMYDRVYSPGYYEAIDTRYFWESNLYDMATKELVYSVQTESFNPASSENLGHEYGQLIIKDMTKAGLMAVRKGF